jgi:hypothetical protein
MPPRLCVCLEWCDCFGQRDGKCLAGQSGVFRVAEEVNAKGSYRLQAVPNDAAGKGAAVSVKFEVK